MKQLLLLLKILILDFFGINRLFHGGKTEVKTFFTGLGILLAGLFIVFYSVTLAFTCTALGMSEIIPSIMILPCTAVSFFTVFFKSPGFLFGFKDYEFLVSLPIRKHIILISRLCSLYALEFVFSLVILFPSLVVYGIFSDASFSVWVMIFLSPLLVPLLPMTAAVVLGTGLSLLSLRFRHRNAVVIILSMAAVIALITWSFNIRFSNNGEIISFVTNLELGVFRFYPPAVLYSLAISSGKGLSFFFFAFLSFIPLVLFTAVLSKWYGRINSAMMAVKGRGGYYPENPGEGISRRNDIRGKFYALYVRELRRFIASPVYILNTVIGAVLLIMTAVFLSVTGIASFESGLGMPGLFSAGSFAENSGGSFVLPFFPAIFIALANSAASSISLEGKTRWLVSSLPLKTGKLYAAKLLLNLSVTIPAILIAAPLFAHVLSLEGIALLFIFITPLVYSFLTAVLGLAINLRFPKYDWKTEQQAVKQSASVVFAMLAGSSAALIPMVLIFVFPGFGACILVLTTTIAALGAFFLFRKISGSPYYGFT